MILLKWKRLKEIWVFKKEAVWIFIATQKKRYFLHIVLLVVFLILLLINAFNILTNRSTSYLGILSNGLLAIAMILQIRAYKKQNK
jgi:hypothetical protein